MSAPRDPGAVLRAAAAIVESAADKRGIPHWHQIAERLREAAPREESNDGDDAA